ncbi:MAG: alkyl hydroperoxide reductase subunit F [Acidobacteria bacterium]|nr:MAG: alkyl hydroperoxide reductase subunit F [Acidobacteriota bacterium]
MIDKQMLNEIKKIFAGLKHEIELVLNESNHEKQGELEDMLSEVASTSDKVKLGRSGVQKPSPSFSLKYDGALNGISFTGIPGGHEFSSLILAILNSDGQGKYPDAGIIKRIKSLKGPICLKTYISLSCENCPDVVQSLNLMAILHDDFRHEMVDGAFEAEEIQKLGIQGVPSVMSGDQLVSSGKVGLPDLLKKLEITFGKEEGTQEPVDLGLFDVAVIGGGPAGASAAIYSSRKGLKTAVVAENIGGQVKETVGIENFISIPYTEGPQLASQIAEHMSRYEMELLEHRRVDKVELKDETKKVQLDSGEFFHTKSLIVATGAKWRELGIPGEQEYLGKGVAFCPHCDGPYYKGKDIAVIGGGNSGVEAAIDLAGIVKSVTVLEFLPELKADQVLVDKLLSLPNVQIIKNARTKGIKGNGKKVNELIYVDRATEEEKSLKLDGVFVQIGLMPNSQCVKDVVETNRFGEIVIDQKCKTNVPGVYAAGDVTTVPYKQIVISMGEGAKAALTAFEEHMLKG